VKRKKKKRGEKKDRLSTSMLANIVQWGKNRNKQKKQKEGKEKKEKKKSAGGEKH